MQSSREGTQGALLCIWFAQTPSAWGQQQLQVGQSRCHPYVSHRCPSLVSPTPTSAATRPPTANDTPRCTDTCLILKVIKTNLTKQPEGGRCLKTRAPSSLAGMAPGAQALLAVVPASLVAPKLSHGRACDTSGRAAGPSRLVVPREGPQKAALGQRRKKTNTETHPAWRRRQSLCKAGSQHGCGQGTRAWVLCRWLCAPHSSRGHPKVSVGQAVPRSTDPVPGAPGWALLWHRLSSTTPRVHRAAEAPTPVLAPAVGLGSWHRGHWAS